MLISGDRFVKSLRSSPCEAFIGMIMVLVKARIRNFFISEIGNFLSCKRGVGVVFGV